MSKTTTKDRVLAALYGAIPVIELSNDDIQYVKENLPALLSKETNTNSEAKIDFTPMKFNHKAESFYDAVGMDKKDVKSLDRKIEDIFEESQSQSTSRSVALESLLKELSMKEIVWLMDYGVRALQDDKAKEALLKMIGIHRSNKDHGNDSKRGPISPDLTEE